MIELLIFCAFYNYRAPLATEKVDPRCMQQEQTHAWIFFTDKGITVEKYGAALLAVRSRLGSAAIERRLKRRGTIDYGDIPVNEDYLQEIENHGALLIKRSNWLNAASFLISRSDIERIASHDFVHKIRPVAIHKISLEEEKALEQDTSAFTYRQLRMFNIDSLHQLGILGSGVKIGFLDSGFRQKHSALDNVRIIAEHDFMSGDRLYNETSPITEKYGIYSNIVFHRTSSRLNLFLEGDTVLSNLPTRDILYMYSTDDGSSWSQLIKLTQNYHSWANEVAVCGRDTVFVFYRDRNGIQYLAMDTAVIYGPAFAAEDYGREPSAVQFGDSVYLFYQSYKKLYMQRGNLFGFSGETIVDTSSTNIKKPIALIGNSEIGVLYYNFPTDSIFFIHSPFPAGTFSKRFTGMVGKNPQAVTSGDTIFLAYQDAANAPLFRVAYAVSNDFGATFQPGIYLSDLLSSIGKLSIARDGSTIDVAWESQGKIFSRVSYDNGSTFGGLDSLAKEFAYLPTLGATASGISKFYCERGDSSTDGYLTQDPKYKHPRHGTEMVGLVAGYSMNTYTGVAPGVQLIIAKTESPDDSIYEFPVEEDTYVAGLEWAESKGADIISSSLGYSSWYSPYDYDGKTSPASIAAYEATKRGVVVVTAAGNFSIPQLAMPGDAIDVITVGGIDTTFRHWENSGFGPTYDGRMKPEIVCLSAAPIVVEPDSSNSYLYSFGTSGATAIGAGICALLLEGHPGWIVDSVRNALFSTASRADSPGDTLGYGWPDALAAFYSSPPIIDTATQCSFLTPYPNPFTASVHTNIYLPFSLNARAYVEFRVYSISGKLVLKNERTETLMPGKYTDTDPFSPSAAFSWDGKDDKGNDVGSGVYYCVLITYGAGNAITKIVVVR